MSIQFDIDAQGLRDKKVWLDRLDHTELPAAMTQTAVIAVNRLIRLLKQPTAFWSSQPAFDRKIRVSSRGAEATVTTDDKRYLWTNYGTRPHVIRPKGPGYPLRFQGGYSPATRPGSLAPGIGKATGSVIYAYEVHHPGTRARRFDIEAIKGTEATLVSTAKMQVSSVIRDR